MSFVTFEDLVTWGREVLVEKFARNMVFYSTGVIRWSLNTKNEKEMSKYGLQKFETILLKGLLKLTSFELYGPVQLKTVKFSWETVKKLAKKIFSMVFCKDKVNIIIKRNFFLI